MEDDRRRSTDLSTPSLGITRDANMSSSRRGRMIFQLPLSGSQMAPLGFPDRVPSRSLSTPSLGITGRWKVSSPAAFRQTFNSLSRDHWPRSPCPRRAPISFNSLSRDHRKLYGIRIRWPRTETFNSLSRDHESTKAKANGLRTIVAFNSLSRDHRRHNLPAVRSTGRVFQLPLSGSHNYGSDDDSDSGAFNSLSRDHGITL